MLTVERDVVIPRSREECWSQFIRFEDWGKWNRFIVQARLMGEFKDGAIIKLKFALLPIPIPVTCRIVELEEGKTFGWKGGGPGVKAVHRWIFEEAGQTQTRLVSTETVSGPAERLVRPVMERLVTGAAEKSLAGFAALMAG